MSRQNTAKLDKPDREKKINSSQSAVSVADIENGTSSFAGKRLHFIGAGGVGMSGLARLLIKNHAIVSGSDQEQTAVTDRLCEWGADIKIGHHEKHLDPTADAVVISAAIKEENPELILARSKGLKIYKYAQMLGQLCNFYEGVAIAGTHGKSTTSG